MPYRRNYKNKKRTRKSYRKNYRYALNKQHISRPLIPKSTVVSLRYVEERLMVPGLSSANAWVFRANSIRDPNLTTAGHQPMGYDQMSVFYNRATVIGAKITATFFNASDPDDQNGNNVVGVILKDTGNTVLHTQELMESPRCSFRYVTGRTSMATVTKHFSAKKFFNVANIKDNQLKLGHLTGTDPSEDAYFHVFAGAIDRSDNTPNAIMCNVVINYIVMFTDPKHIGQS